VIDWIVSMGLTPYETALQKMEQRVAAIQMGNENESIWLLEHPSLYTAGTSARPHDLIHPKRFPVIHVSRGGQYTYHGPGQRVIYVMLNLNQRGKDIHTFIEFLEHWVVDALESFGLRPLIHKGRIGVWVERPEKPSLPDGQVAEDKIAAIGIRLRKWISFHGISINVDPDLEHYSSIVPCGIKDYGVTSLVDLGLPVTMADLDIAIHKSFCKVSGEQTLNASSIHHTF